MLIDALAGIISRVPTNIAVADVLVDVNVNVFAGVMPAFEFDMSVSLEEFRC